MKKLKPSQIPQWLWGLILLGIILAGTLLVQQLFISERVDASEQAPLGSASLVLDWILKLAFFLSLLFVGLYFARRWQRGASGVASRRVQILESRHLSPKQAVHLISADGRTFLIGATDQSLTLLSEIQVGQKTNSIPANLQFHLPMSCSVPVPISWSHMMFIMSAGTMYPEGPIRNEQAHPHIPGYPGTSGNGSIILRSDTRIQCYRVSLDINTPGGPEQVSSGVQLLVLITILSLAPSILVLMTSFTRMVIVLSMVRTAIGTPTVPPNQVVLGLALLLTFFVMTPVYTKMDEQAIQPYLNEEIDQETAWILLLSRCASLCRAYTREGS